MPAHNPFSAPSTRVVDPSAPLNSSANKPIRYLLAALVVLQLLATWRYSSAYFELVRTGASHPLALLLGLVGSVCLYVGAIRSLLPNPKGHNFLLVATVTLGLSVPMWRLPYAWSLVAAFGAVLALASWWAVRQSARLPQLQAVENG
jgi:hypothetical protein